MVERRSSKPCAHVRIVSPLFLALIVKWFKTPLFHGGSVGSSPTEGSNGILVRFRNIAQFGRAVGYHTCRRFESCCSAVRK